MAAAGAALKLKRLRQRFGIRAPKVAVRTHVAWYWRAAAIVGMLSLSLALAAWIYDAGRSIAGFDSSSSSQQLDTLHQRIAELEAESAGLRGVASAADSNLQIERTAQQRLADQVKALEAENVVLKQDLAFYESLIPETASGEPGVRINRLRIDPEGVPGQYRYRMLLVFNGGKQEKEYRGELQLQVKVQLGGKDAMISFPPEGGRDSTHFRLEIKHFQRIEGVFSVPPGAVVKSVEARVLQDGTVRARQTVNL